jgi:radical SAM superfamily enzyme YgiQ (UPF0313 family)
MFGRQSARAVVNTVERLYRDRTLYTSQDMFSPPSERLPHVIRFELTQGCSWGRCTYCGGFDGVPSKTKSLKEYKEHVDAVWDRVSPGLAYKLRRVFIGGGNALGVETDTLSKAIKYTLNKFDRHADGLPNRTAIYGRTDDILKKGVSGLRKLKNVGRNIFGSFGGLDLIYWGVESGSDGVLKYVNKGYTQKQIIEAAEIVRSAGIDTSVMIMPGLGGIKFYDEHIQGTARVLNKIRPKYLTFMGINPASQSRYSVVMNREVANGSNRPLKDQELATQMWRIIRKMGIWDCKVGCFDCHIDQVGHNPLPFGSTSISDEYDRNDLLRNLAFKICTKLGGDPDQLYDQIR